MYALIDRPPTTNSRVPSEMTGSKAPNDLPNTWWPERVESP